MDAELSLITKYRPGKWSEVVGQDEVVSSIRRVIAAKSSKCFLLVGPSGTGKTTLGRLIAHAVGCQPANLIEVNASSSNGIDDMRALTSKLTYRSMTPGSPIKVVLIDEAHGLTKGAINAILKDIEEPPEHVWWVFCTTEGDRVIETIRNRCTRYMLNPVGGGLLVDLLRKMREKEGWATPDEVVELVARKAQGSPRRAISGLAACHACADKEEALGVLHEVDTDSPEVIDLCRMFLNGRPRWDAVCEKVRPWKDLNPESVRIVMSAYFSKVALSGKPGAEKALEILSAFEKPYPNQSGIAPLLLSLGRLVFQGN